jgi:hypothetical protein
MRPILYTLDEHGTPVPLLGRNRHEVLRWAKSVEGNRVVKRSLLFHSIESPFSLRSVRPIIQL